jgi:hypothetical protein
VAGFFGLRWGIGRNNFPTFLQLELAEEQGGLNLEQVDEAAALWRSAEPLLAKSARLTSTTCGVKGIIASLVWFDSLALISIEIIVDIDFYVIFNYLFYLKY